MALVKLLTRCDQVNSVVQLQPTLTYFCVIICSNCDLWMKLVQTTHLNFIFSSTLDPRSISATLLFYEKMTNLQNIIHIDMCDGNFKILH